MHLLDFLKVGWYSTRRRRIAKVYPLFKAFRLRKNTMFKTLGIV